MGKRIIQQRRGRGTHTYKSPSHRFKGEVKHVKPAFEGENSVEGVVVDFIHCAGHSAPLMLVEYEDGGMNLSFAVKGMKVGDRVQVSAAKKEVAADGKLVVASEEELIAGAVLTLSKIPEGTLIHNIEARPGDGGKFVRGSGAFARVVAKNAQGVRVKLPSKKEKLFLPNCRASIGSIAGSGRVEKPFLKAGTRFYRMKARNKLYPKVCGISMNAVDHPFGSKCSHVKGRPTLSPRSAPPGRKVGKIAPRRTGRKR